MNAIVKTSNELLAPQLDYFLVDGSDSMLSKWWEMLAGLDHFTSALKTANAHAHGIASVFSGSNIQMIQRDSLIATWRPFKDEPLQSTWHGTPLYDAINLMGRHLQILNPARCSIVIVTDGEENCSRTTSVEQARAVLDWCRAHGWSVTFLGADFNNSLQSKQLGADSSNSLGVRKELLSEAGKLLAKKRLSGEDIAFSDDEKLQFGGYLTND